MRGSRDLEPSAARPVLFASVAGRPHPGRDARRNDIPVRRLVPTSAGRSRGRQGASVLQLAVERRAWRLSPPAATALARRDGIEPPPGDRRLALLSLPPACAPTCRSGSGPLHKSDRAAARAGRTRMVSLSPFAFTRPG